MYNIRVSSQIYSANICGRVYLLSLSIYINISEMVKNIFRSCDGNSGFFHDLIFREVSEFDDIV